MWTLIQVEADELADRHRYEPGRSLLFLALNVVVQYVNHSVLYRLNFNENEVENQARDRYTEAAEMGELFNILDEEGSVIRNHGLKDEGVLATTQANYALFMEQVYDVIHYLRNRFYGVLEAINQHAVVTSLRVFQCNDQYVTLAAYTRQLIEYQGNHHVTERYGATR